MTPVVMRNAKMLMYTKKQQVNIWLHSLSFQVKVYADKRQSNVQQLLQDINPAILFFTNQQPK